MPGHRIHRRAPVRNRPSLCPPYLERNMSSLLALGLRPPQGKLLSRFSSIAASIHDTGSTSRRIYLDGVKPSLSTFYYQMNLPKLKLNHEVALGGFFGTLAPWEENVLLYSSSQDKESLRKCIISSRAGLQEALRMSNKYYTSVNPISDMMTAKYLKDRRPLVINTTPFIAFNPDPRYQGDQLHRAAHIILSSVRFNNSMLSNRLSPEVYQHKLKLPKALRLLKYVGIPDEWSPKMYHFPLDMSQLPKMFGTARIPDTGMDKLVTYQGSKHVAVMCNGHVFKLSVNDSDGEICSASSLYNALEAIKGEAKIPSEYPLGYMTGGDRDKWAEIRVQLLQDVGNVESIDAIDRAMFVVCLDDVSCDEVLPLSKNFLVGDGANRWFDKSVSFIVTANAQAGMTFEHTWGDGLSIIRLIKELHNDINVDFQPVTANQPLAPYTRLQWNFSDNVKGAIAAAKKSYDDNARHLLMSVGQTPLPLSESHTDSMAQFVLLSAFKQLYRKLPAIYESCSMCLYKEGRTETMRPVTSSAVKAYRSIFSEKSSPDLEWLLKTSASDHKANIKKCLMGKGYDRTLSYLQEISKLENISVPLFDDPYFNVWRHHDLSTSTLESTHVAFGGFGPVVPDGLGVAYRKNGKTVQILATGFRDGKHPSEFTEELERVTKHMRSRGIMFSNAS